MMHGNAFSSLGELDQMGLQEHSCYPGGQAVAHLQGKGNRGPVVSAGSSSLLLLQQQRNELEPAEMRRDRPVRHLMSNNIFENIILVSQEVECCGG